jgi:hypothetical protein
MFKARIILRSLAQQGAQILQPFNDEHGLEGWMAEIRIDRLQDEAVGSNGHGRNPIL